MPQGKAYVSFAIDGSVTGVCIIVDDRQSQQAIRSLKRSHPGTAIVQMSLTRALAAMREHSKETYRRPAEGQSVPVISCDKAVCS